MSVLDALKRGLASLLAYFRGQTAEAAAWNTIAATVIGNIPFYPLYVAAIVGGRAWPSLLALLSLPFFIAVPPLGRRGARAGRICLLAAGLVDTALCTFGLGPTSGVELFYLPIALLPLILYRDETIAARALMLAAVALTFGAGRTLGSALARFTSAETHSMTILHVVSVGALSILILVSRWRLGPPGPTRRAAAEP